VASVLVDAGPLVALIDRSDTHHQACKRVLERLREPLVTVWPAFTEAMYLLSFSWKAQSALWELVSSSAFSLVSLGPDDYPRIRELMEKYSDLPMELADAALVTVAERERLHRIFTLDRRDFGVYRPKRLRRFTIIP
jgi:predicted nucleic acid-binding protein